jgi:hypothetical protein
MVISFLMMCILSWWVLDPHHPLFVATRFPWMSFLGHLLLSETRLHGYAFYSNRPRFAIVHPPWNPCNFWLSF